MTKHKNIKRSTIYNQQQKWLIRINLTKDVHDVYGENYNTLMNEIKIYRNKQKYATFVISGFNTIKA